MASTPEEIQADIEQQRERLARTVDELSARLDVKSRARARLARWRSAATTSEGQVRPEVLSGAAAVSAAVVVILLRRRRH